MTLKPETGMIEAGVHKLPLRIYYEDTDAGGIVYHARYLAFFERARTEMLRCLGIEQQAMLESPPEKRLAFAVRRLTIDYLRPAKLDDALTIETRVEAMTGARLKIHQILLSDQGLMVEARVEVALIGGDGRPKRLNSELSRLFQATLRGHWDKV